MEQKFPDPSLCSVPLEGEQKNKFSEAESTEWEIFPDTSCSIGGGWWGLMEKEFWEGKRQQETLLLSHLYQFFRSPSVVAAKQPTLCYGLLCWSAMFSFSPPKDGTGKRNASLFSNDEDVAAFSYQDVYLCRQGIAWYASFTRLSLEINRRVFLTSALTNLDFVLLNSSVPSRTRQGKSSLVIPGKTKELPMFLPFPWTFRLAVRCWGEQRMRLLKSPPWGITSCNHSAPFWVNVLGDHVDILLSTGALCHIFDIWPAGTCCRSWDQAGLLYFHGHALYFFHNFRPRAWCKPSGLLSHPAVLVMVIIAMVNTTRSRPVHMKLQWRACIDRVTTQLRGFDAWHNTLVLFGTI